MYGPLGVSVRIVPDIVFALMAFAAVCVAPSNALARADCHLEQSVYVSGLNH
jgi:hypothetical protein